MALSLKRISCFALLIFSLAAAGETSLDTKFRPLNWVSGLHLFAGGGLSTSTYYSSSEQIDWGLGLNLKTDLGFYFAENWAIEWSSLSRFTRVNGYLVWDTLISWGVRFKLMTSSSSVWYGRLFAGRSPSLIKFEGSSPEEFRSQGVDRIRLDGPAYGVALGQMRSLYNHRTWFIEVIGSLQDVRFVEGIQIRHEVPEVHFHETLNEQTQIVTLSLCVGLYVF